MQNRDPAPPLRRILAVWPHRCEGLAVIAVPGGTCRTARPGERPAPDARR